MLSSHELLLHLIKLLVLLLVKFLIDASLSSLVSSKDVLGSFFAISSLKLVLVLAHLVLLLEDVIAVHRLLSFLKFFIHSFKVFLKLRLDFNELVFFLVVTSVL